jgi:hypothetical protein
VSLALVQSAPVLGSTLPRLFTPPLVAGAPGPCGCGCALTDATSLGFDVVQFATDVLMLPPDPWERWLLIHGLEVLPDGRPRFRQLLVLVARQNGKSLLAVILCAYWQFIEQVPMILGTSTKLDYAKEAWAKTVATVERAPELTEFHPAKWTRQTNGEQESWTYPADDTGEASRYKIAASNELGGRSLTIHRLILDELRHHYSYLAWGASVPAGNAVRDFQVWALSNMGDDRSVVLNDLRDQAVDYLKTGDGDPRLMLAEWSCPEESDPTDLGALALANPNLGRRIDPDALVGEAARAVKAGGAALAMFKTEVMCIRVPRMNPAISAEGWARQLEVGDLAGCAGRIAMVIDVSTSLQHATLYAAAVLADGRVRVDFVHSWEGVGCADRAGRELPGMVARMRVKPRALGWLPTGPAASIGAALADRTSKGRRGWPPAGVQVEEIRGEIKAVCMGFAELVDAGQVVHSGDPLLDAHANGAEKLEGPSGGWVFSRKGDGDCDAVYAAAGAAHLARTLPTSLGVPRLIIAAD